MGVKVREYKGRPGIWGVFIHHRGQRTSKMVGPSKRDAEAIAREVRKELAAGDLGVFRDRASTVPTFETYAETFVARQEKRIKASSAERYASAIETYLRPRLGALPLDRIDARDLRGVIDDLEAKHLAPATIRHALRVASALFEMARKDELVRENPARGVSGDVSRKRPPEVEPLERDELATLLAEAEKRLDPLDWLRVLVLARTGMRPGEVAALRVGDIDLRHGFAVVRRSYDDNHGVGTPKSGKTRRVDLSPQLVAALKARLSERAVVDLDPVRRRDAWLFPSPDDPTRPAHVNEFRRRVNAVARRVGIGRFKLKLFRHTYASHLLVYENAPTHYVQDQLGHHSPDFTLRVYGHLLSRDRGRYADRLDGAVVAATGEDARDVTG